MNPIPPRISETHFAVLNDGTIPIGQVDGPVRPHGDINGTKRNVGRSNQIVELDRPKTASFLVHPKAIDSIGSEVIGQDLPAHLLRQMSATQDLDAAEFGASRVEPGQEAQFPR